MTARAFATAVAVAMAASAPAPARAAGARDAAARPLTPPSTRDPVEIGLDHLFGRSRIAGPAGARTERTAEGAEYEVSAVRTSPSGTTSVVLRQVHDGIEVWKGSRTVHVDAHGRVLRADDRTKSRPSSLRRKRATSTLTPLEATHHAFDQLGIVPREELQLLEEPQGVDQACRISGAGVAHDPITARLMWLPAEHLPRVEAAAGTDAGEEPAPRLAWNIWIVERRSRGAWEVNVDAATGELLTRHDRLERDRYRVYAEPLASPLEGERTLVVDPADPVASPHGWHDTDGIPGAEFTVTWGNNAVALVDGDGDDETLGPPAVGGPGLIFDFAIDDHDFAPENSRNAAVTNAFYWVSRLHDVFYRYGFDEQSGNFQQNPNGNPTLSPNPDAVLVDVQDGWDIDDPNLRNNAFFFTPRDGEPARMELFIWTNSRPRVHIAGPSAIVGRYPGGSAAFGSSLGAAGVSGRVIRALDATEGPENTSTDGCSAISNPMELAGRIALIDRGGCDFVDKVENAQAAGAISVIVVNNRSSDLVDMVAPEDWIDPGVVIPSIFLGRHNGRRISEQLAAGVDVTVLQPDQTLELDSAFSSGTITHEFGHGVSNRLTGGALTTSCLDDPQANAMGEGWSDFFELVMTAQPSDTRATLRSGGAYLWGESLGGGGIRRFPYTTSTDDNPLSYGDLAATAVPPPFREHDGGEIWASALWEMYWNLVELHGFEPDLHTGYSGNSDGNALALQLVVDGLALQPCEPTFVEARDAILQAEFALTGGDNACALWRGFAARGLGVSADDGGGANVTDVTEAFDAPQACPEPETALLQGLALLGIAALRPFRSQR